MKKKALCAILAVFLIAGVFAACKKDSGNKYGLAVTEQSGIPRVLVTDENGKIAMDESGKNYAVIVTEKNGSVKKDDKGEAVTNYISANSVFYTKGKVETIYFSIAIPKGWNDSSSSYIVLNNEANTVSFKLFFSKTYDEFIKEQKNFELMVEEGRAQENSGIKEYESKYSDETVLGVTAKKLSVTMTLEVQAEDNKTETQKIFIENYVFEKDKKAYMITYQHDGSEKVEADFEMLLNSVKFR